MKIIECLFSWFPWSFGKSNNNNNNNNNNMSNNYTFKDIINGRQYVIRLENASVVVKSLVSDREVEFKSMLDSQANEHSMRHLTNKKFLICITSLNIRTLDWKKICEVLEQKAAIGSMVFAVIHESSNQSSTLSEFYQTSEYRYLKERNNYQDIPVVFIMANSNYTSPFENQIHILELQKEKDLMQTSNTKGNNLLMEGKSKIAFTEKSKTYATSKVFEKLFGLEFRPDQYEYKLIINNRPVTIFYMALEDSKADENYYEECKKRLRDCDLVICFEYCNPRVQEIDQNIRELRKLDVEIDSVVEFVFYSAIRMDKSQVLEQLDKFLECQHIDNLARRVHVHYSTNASV